MNTKTFNENYELDKKSRGVRANPKTAEPGPDTIRTADGENFDPNETYYFFDSQATQVRQSTSLRRDGNGEHLCALGLKVIAIAKLRANRDDALSDAQSFFQSEIERLQSRIQKLELEKTGEKRKLTDFSMINN